MLGICVLDTRLLDTLEFWDKDHVKNGQGLDLLMFLPGTSRRKRGKTKQAEENT